MNSSRKHEKAGLYPFSDTPRKRPRLLLNASNLHVGGGVQVATSLIYEFTQMSNLPSSLVVWASSEVDANLRILDADLATLPAYDRLDSHGLNLLISPLHRRLQDFDVVLTVFGPLYVYKLSGVNITGFAQSWIIYPVNEIATSMSWFRRYLTRLRFNLQTFFFRRADHFVVELEHVRLGLLERRIGNDTNITLIRNSLSSIYSMPASWREVSVPDVRSKIKLGFLGRNYVHKNTAILPEVVRLLRTDYGLDVAVYVTFSPEEWKGCSTEFRKTVTNVGPLFAAQCPAFYNQMDGIIFPSLLECCSITPLEAMAMRKPLFASNRLFNRDVCQDYAHYFDPTSPASVAKVIAKFFLSDNDNSQNLQAAQEYAINFSSPRVRAEQYLGLLLGAAEKPRYDSKKT